MKGEVKMILGTHDENGVYVMSGESELNEKTIERFNKQFGVGGWKYTVQKLSMCHCLEPACGYGPPLEHCPFKESYQRCIRPAASARH
jgi:hypothetical protein